MDRSKPLCQIVPNITSKLYIVLYVYAAISKFIDFGKFKVQLGQSPILTAYVDHIAWSVPITELAIALLLLFPRFSRIAFYACLSLMTMFTTYILLILNFSEYIPCSCGGILENMSWSEHLVFNLILIVFAIVSILMASTTKRHPEKKIIAQ